MTNEEALKYLQSSDIYKIIFQNIPLHVVITDTDAKVIAANKEVERITGFSQEEIIGQNPRLWGGLMPKSFYDEFWDTIKVKQKPYVGVIKNRKKNGRPYMAALKVTPIFSPKKELIGFCGIEQDMSEIQELSDTHDINERQRLIFERTSKFK